MGHNFNYDAWTFSTLGGHLFEYSFVFICPKIYVDSLRNYYWQHRDTDSIDESLGILLDFSAYTICFYYNLIGVLSIDSILYILKVKFPLKTIWLANTIQQIDFVDELIKCQIL